VTEHGGPGGRTPCHNAVRAPRAWG
jgi:hypothetical protein